MSYILDALRRADAERQQGGVPGLHTPASPQPAAPAAPKPWLLWGGAGLLLLGLGALLAWWWARPAPVVVAVVSAVVAAPAVAPAATGTPAGAPVLSPLPIVVSAAPVLQTPVQTPLRTPMQTPMQAPMQTPMPTSAPAQGASPTAMAAAVQASQAQPKVVPLQQLAAELRRELPPLALGGSVWSDNPASRFVILDGQVVREGDSVAPGLLLERIQPRAVVLRWRDMRLEIKL